MKIGDKLTGRITGVQPYGAFVELETGVTGLIHISEIRTGFIENIYDILKIGDEVQVRWWILTNILERPVFPYVPWKRKSINYQDGDVFQMIGSSTDLLLLPE